jgi:transcription-repair coupling factor (superfamily II helicase)
MDIFGEVPETIKNLLRVSLLRTRAHAPYVLEIKGGDGSIELKISPAAKIDPGKIPGFIAGYKGSMQFHSAGTPVFIYKYKKEGSPEKAAAQLLTDTESIVEKMQQLLV